MDVKQLESRSLKLMNFMYYFMGGMYTSPRISKRMRQTWGAFNAMSFFLFVVSPTIYFLLTTPLDGPIDLIDVSEALLGQSIIITFGIILPLIVIYFHVEIETVLEYLESSKVTDFGTLFTATFSSNAIGAKEVKKYESPPNVFIKYRNSVTIPAGNLIFAAIFDCIYASIPIYYVTFFYEGKPNLLQLYPLSAPFYDRVPSLRVYNLIGWIEVFCLAGPIACAICQSIFVIAFALVMNNVMISYCKHVHNLSDIAQQFIDENNQQRSPEFIRNFEKDLATIIDKYAEFTAAVRKIHAFLEVCCSLMVIFASVAQFVNIYFFLGIQNEPNQRFLNTRHMVFICPGIVYLFDACYAGNVITEASEAVSYEVYNLPWYYMPPKTRRLINVFQNALYHPWELKVIGVYPVTMALFPRVMNAVYSFFNIIRTSLNAKN